MALLRRLVRASGLTVGASACDASLIGRAAASVDAALSRPRHSAARESLARPFCRTHQTCTRGGEAVTTPAARACATAATATVTATATATATTAATVPSTENVTPSAAIVRQAWHRPDVAVVLVHPQIPQNTGNVARTCAATAAPLHLVGPLGFQLEDRKLKRAGLDYWDAVTMATHSSWPAFFAFFKQLPGPKRLVAFTVYGETYYAGPEFCYQPGDWLVFGAETSGLPPEAHADVVASGGALVKIPIRDTHVRSINLSVAVGVGLFEAVRQLDEAEGHVVASRQSPTLEEIAAAHRDGKPLGPKAGAWQSG
ncbi:hypothetical protein PLESTB_000621200 [Pleodorina starrii]|uniref:tRNA/rRNA methyltransferase SpoU type domain-containing protein n=1 Tax=Pleodorina starrii TaxID=330485 RepID=A0A9W6F145_9CHLO|nr:hypothetical protein PLESTM_001731600 [Pleodorina starrii]GLC52364.1 hypothetical protein PLESTB_000621200 [Pleodorina starrii]GLC67968.1 hypothetical protein PLESTF_000629100 [Pleodorina starrii]